LGQRSQVSTIDPAPLFPFGHGHIEVALGYTLTGQRREVGFDRVLHPEITLLPPD
jgi:hypothetical protein